MLALTSLSNGALPQQTPNAPGPTPRSQQAGSWHLLNFPAKCRMPFCPLSAESDYSPLYWTKHLPVAAFLLPFQSGCPSHVLTAQEHLKGK